MNVLFIYPNFNSPYGINYGLASISSVLKANGHNCKLMHLVHNIDNDLILHNIYKTIDEFNPDLIGFSVLTHQYSWSLKIGKAIKSRYSIPLIVGGVHCIMEGETVAGDRIWDYVCVGEGEFALLELLSRLEKGLCTESISNMLIWSNDELIRNKISHITDLNALPNPDYELFDLKSFLSSQNGWMRLMISRGCPNRCSYCLSNKIISHYVKERAIKNGNDFLRFHSIPMVIDNIRYLKEKFPEIKTLNFDDDLFTLNKEFVIQFAKQYRKSGIGLPYVINAHVQFFDNEIAKYLKDSGCTIVRFGIESGSEELRRRVLRRFMSNEDIKRAFDAAKNANLHTSAFLMIGIPHETVSNIFDTINLCAAIKMGRFRWSYLYPYYGTEIYETAYDAGIINKNAIDNTFNYFDNSCFNFGKEHNLLLQKLGKAFNWYVNAASGWQCSYKYKKLVSWLSEMDWDSWLKNKNCIKEIDMETSDFLMRREVPHYRIHYSNVMGVNSEYIRKEAEASLSNVILNAA